MVFQLEEQVRELTQRNRELERQNQELIRSKKGIEAFDEWAYKFERAAVTALTSASGLISSSIVTQSSRPSAVLCAMWLGPQMAARSPIPWRRWPI